MIENVFIIIVTHNGMKWLSKTLKCIKTHKVIIIDNNSTDGTISFIENNYPKIRLHKSNRNLGFGRANNLAISYALKNGADYVFLLNQDAYLKDNCLDVLIKWQKANGDYGILSPVHLNGKGDKLDKGFYNYIKQSSENLNEEYLMHNKKASLYDLPFVNAAGWLISKDCLKVIGGFDPIFFHYGEDVNYCQRLAYHGFKIGVISNSFIHHDRENREIKERPFGSKEFFRNMEIDLKVKYGNINNDNEKGLTELIEVTKKELAKSLFNILYRKASFFIKQLMVLYRVKKEVRNSKEINKQPGLTYLNLNF